ncbi:MAG: Hsp20 family protein, partial [Arsenophonus sp. ER-EMS1-MAG3]
KDHYEMIISVPGYTQDELDISVLNNQLTISGKPKVDEKHLHKENDNIKWLHKRIRKNEFSLSFSLEHRITIQKANLDKGLLILHFTYNIPEQEKPKKIIISAQHKSSSADSLEHNTI